MRPRNVLLAFHKNQVFAFGMRFWSKKPTKNPSKTRPEPFKNPPRCSQRQACQTLLHFLLALNYYRGGPHGVIGRVFGLHVGAMLASLSLLGASWAHFSRLAARVGAVGRFSCVLECSGHDFGTSWALFSWLLKRPWPHFSKFFCTTCVMAQMR